MDIAQNQSNPQTPPILSVPTPPYKSSNLNTSNGIFIKIITIVCILSILINIFFIWYFLKKQNTEPTKNPKRDIVQIDKNISPTPNKSSIEKKGNTKEKDDANVDVIMDYEPGEDSIIYVDEEDEMEDKKREYLERYEDTFMSFDISYEKVAIELKQAIIRYYAIKSRLPWNTTSRITQEMKEDAVKQYISEIIAAGELKSDYLSYQPLKDFLSNAYLTYDNTSFAICYPPFSKKYIDDINTKFTKTGTPITDGTCPDINYDIFSGIENLHCYRCISSL